MKKSFWKRFVSTVAAAAMAVMSVPVGVWAVPASDDVTDVKDLNPKLEYKSEEFSEEINDGIVENGTQVAARVEATFTSGATTSPKSDVWYYLEFPVSKNFVPIEEGSKDQPVKLYNTAGIHVGWYYIKDGNYYFYVDEIFANSHPDDYVVWFEYHGRFQFDQTSEGKEEVWYGEEGSLIEGEVYPEFNPTLRTSKTYAVLTEAEKAELGASDPYIVKYQVEVTASNDHLDLTHVTDCTSKWLEPLSGADVPEVEAVYKKNAYGMDGSEERLTVDEQLIAQDDKTTTYNFILEPPQRIASGGAVVFTYYMAVKEEYFTSGAEDLISNTATSYANKRNGDVIHSEYDGTCSFPPRTQVIKSGEDMEDGSIEWTVTVIPGVDFNEVDTEDWYFTDKLGDYQTFADDAIGNALKDGELSWEASGIKKGYDGSYTFSYTTEVDPEMKKPVGNVKFENTITLHMPGKNPDELPYTGYCYREGVGVAIFKEAVPNSYDAVNKTVDWKISFTLTEGVESYQWTENSVSWEPTKNFLVDRYDPNYTGDLEKLDLAGIVGVYYDEGIEKQLVSGKDYTVEVDINGNVTVSMGKDAMKELAGKRIEFIFPSGVPEGFDPNSGSFDNTVNASYTVDGSYSTSKDDATYFFPLDINKGNLEKEGTEIKWAGLMDYGGFWMPDKESGTLYSHPTDEMVWTLQINKEKLMTEELFNRETEIVINDHLPEGLEYVDGSAVVGFLYQGYDKKYVYLYPEMDVKETVTGKDLKLEYTLQDSCNRLSDLEEGEGGYLHAPALWNVKMDDLKGVVILYRTKVQNALDPLKPNSSAPLSKEFQNIAEYTITYDGKNIAEGQTEYTQTFSASEFHILDKKLDSTEKNKLKYTVTVNPTADDLSAGENIRVVDMLEPLEGNEVRAELALTVDKNGKALGISVIDTETGKELDGSLWKYNYNSSTNTLTFTLPDEKALTITYTYNIKGMNGDSAEIGNTVRLDGFVAVEGSTYQAVKTESVKIDMTSSAGATAKAPELTLTKLSADEDYVKTFPKNLR